MHWTTRVIWWYWNWFNREKTWIIAGLDQRVDGMNYKWRRIPRVVVTLTHSNSGYQRKWENVLGVIDGREESDKVWMATRWRKMIESRWFMVDGLRNETRRMRYCFGCFCFIFIELLKTDLQEMDSYLRSRLGRLAEEPVWIGSTLGLNESKRGSRNTFSC